MALLEFAFLSLIGGVHCPLAVEDINIQFTDIDRVGAGHGTEPEFFLRKSWDSVSSSFSKRKASLCLLFLGAGEG